MVLDNKVSMFESTYKTEVKSSVVIMEVLNSIRCGEYADQIKKLRAGDKTIKQHLPTVAMQGLFKHSRKKSNFSEASGLIVLDIDDIEVEDIPEIKQDIMDSDDHVLAVMVSPSGNGIKVLYYVRPELITADNYKQIGKQIIEGFDDYGKVDFLSITDCLIMTHDPDILIDVEAQPAFIYIEQEYVKEDIKLEERDSSKTLWDDPEDFFDTVLYNDISQKTNNNFHFIQVAVLDLKKFGFEHPNEDLSFVIDYAETQFKSSSDNRGRFLEVVEVAKKYTQTRWPYKLTNNEEEEEEEIDYSQYRDDEAGSNLVLTVGDFDNENDDSDGGGDEEDETGLIDYTNFFDQVIQTVEEGDRVGFEISLENFSNIFRFKGSGIFTVTGIPGSGKTEAVDAMTLDLARLHGHETIIAGFEQSPQEHVIKLIRKLVGVDVTCPSWYGEKNMEELKEAYKFITSKFKHINVNKTGGNLHKILDVTGKRIKQSRAEGGNPKYLVLDPFNMLSIKSKASGHEKIEEMLRLLTQFSHQMDVLVILVAHPFKMRKNEKTGEYEVPDFYSVKGSSAFFEMSYHGMVVYRMSNGSVMFKILKVKQNNLGTTGAEVFFDYQKTSGRYIPVDEDGNEMSGDHYSKDWLEKSLKINNK